MADEKHLENFKKGVDFWNQWRVNNLEVQPDLRGADLRGASFGDIDFSNTLLQEAKLVKVNASQANFKGANLNKANLTWASLTSSNFTDANLNNTNASECILDNSNFTNANLSNSNFSKASLRSAIFNSAILNKSNFSSSHFEGAKFDNAKLEGANLTSSNLSSCYLTNAKLDHANFSNARLESTRLMGASLNKANFANATLINVKANGVDFRKTNIAGVQFSRTIADEEMFLPTQLTYEQKQQLGFPERGVKNISDISQEKRKLRGENEGAESGYDNGKNIEVKLQEAFANFLKNEKGYRDNSIQIEKAVANRSRIDMVLSVPETGENIAIIEFKSKNNPKILENASNQIRKYKHSLNQSYILAYIVCPSNNNPNDENKLFVVYEVLENAKVLKVISHDDFPTFTLLSFQCPLSASGRRIYSSLTKLAQNKHGFNIDAPCSEYINLRIKRNANVAAQIHRLKDSNDNIALVLAGYQHPFPVLQSSNYILEGELEQLSGYTNKFPREKSWLAGNVGHPRLKYKAGIYILRPGSLVLEDIENQVNGLFKLAKNNVEKDKKPEMTGIIGNIPTVLDDKTSTEDLLGRDGLIRALANMFVHSKDIDGFTVALFGNWGDGKSTIMGLLERYLKEHHHRYFVFAKFNAWEYEKTDNIAAGLALEVVSGLKKSHNFLCRITLYLCFIVTEHWSRFIWSFIKFALVILPFILLYLFRYQLGLTEEQDEIIDNLLGISLAGAGSIAIGIYILKNFKNIVEHPLVTNLETFLKLPNYGEHLGLIPVLKRHIERLCNLCLKAVRICKWKCGKDKKLIVFVDDLDRCQPACIAETLDAIRLVTENPNIIVFIGIDHRIAFKAIEKHYNKGNRSQKNFIKSSKC